MVAARSNVLRRKSQIRQQLAIYGEVELHVVGRLHIPLNELSKRIGAKGKVGGQQSRSNGSRESLRIGNADLRRTSGLNDGGSIRRILARYRVQVVAENQLMEHAEAAAQRPVE